MGPPHRLGTLEPAGPSWAGAQGSGVHRSKARKRCSASPSSFLTGRVSLANRGHATPNLPPGTWQRPCMRSTPRGLHPRRETARAGLGECYQGTWVSVLARLFRSSGAPRPDAAGVAERGPAGTSWLVEGRRLSPNLQTCFCFRETTPIRHRFLTCRIRVEI